MPIRTERSLRRWLPSCAVALLALTGCGGEPTEEVVVYVSADEHIARAVLDRFEQEHDVRVRMVGDTEAKKTTGLVERLRAEADRPQADVFWSSEVFLTIALSDEGVLAPFEPSNVDGWPARYRDDEGRWWGFGARARVIAYSTERVAEDQRPTTWLELTQHPWKGRIVMADPRFGTTGGHLGAMKAYWDRLIGPAYYEAFLIGLDENETRLLASGNAGVVDAIVSGEADVGMTDTDDVWAAIDAGHPVAMVMPDHDVDPSRRGVGTLLIPNTVGLVAGGPNPEAGRLLATFLLSETAERMLAESPSRNVPLRPGLAEDYPELVVENPLDVDLARAAAEWNAAVTMAIAELRPGASSEDDPAVEPDPADAEAP